MNNLINKYKQMLEPVRGLLRDPIKGTDIDNKIMSAGAGVARTLPSIARGIAKETIIPAAQAVGNAPAFYLKTLPYAKREAEKSANRYLNQQMAATKAQEMGRYDMAKTLMNNSLQDKRKTESYYQMLDPIRYQMAKESGIGGAKSLLNAAGAGVIKASAAGATTLGARGLAMAKAASVPTAIGGGLGGVFAAASGQNVGEGIGQGIGSGLQGVGLQKFTAPIIDPVVDYVGRGKPVVQKYLARALAQGGLNTAEDNLFSVGTQGKKQNADENVLSFLIGAAISPFTSYNPDQSFLKIVDDRLVFDGKRYRNALGEYAKITGEPLNVVKRKAKQATKFLEEEVEIPLTRGGEIIGYTKIKRINAMMQDQSGGVGLNKPGYFDGGASAGAKPQSTDIQTKNPTTMVSQKLTKSEQLRKPENQIGQIQKSQNPSETPSSLVQTLKVEGKTEQPKVQSLESPSSISIPRKTTKASPLNVSRLDLNKKQKNRVLTTQVKELRQVLGDKEIERIAQSSGIDTKTTSIDETARKIAEQLNVRRQVVELENQRTNLIKSGADQKQLEDITRQIAETSRISREQGTDIARQLSARRIIADEINTPMQKVFMLLDAAGVNPDMYVKDAAKVDFSKPEQVVDFYRKYAPAGKSNWLDLVRYNSMLSSPNTHINNFFSNLQGSALVAPIEKTITGSLDAIRSKLTATPRQFYAGEGKAYAKGYFSQVKNARDNFVAVMKGDKLIANPDFRDIPLTTSTSPKRGVENVLKYPMKLLEASDQFFTTLTRGGIEESLKYRIGKSGKNISNAQVITEAEAAKRLFRSKLGENQGSKILDAIDVLGNTIQGLKGNKNPVISTIAKFSLPFVQTPTNILKQGVEYSPLGATTLWGATNKTEQLAKAIMGSSIGIGTALLVGSDRITWAEPTGEKQKAAFKAAGLQPYSVKIGDKWVSYSKLHPAIAFNLAMVAAVKNANENGSMDDSQAETVLRGMSKWLNFFADQSYVKNIGDLVSATKGDLESPTRMVSNYAQQLIPFRALMGWVTRLTDPYQRKVDKDGSLLEKQLQQIATQIPLLSSTVPTRDDVFGNPIENQNRILNAFSPARITTEKTEQKNIYNQMKNKSIEDKQINDIKKQIKRSNGQSVANISGKYVYLKDGEVNTLDVGKVASMPESTNYERALKQKAAWGTVGDIVDNLRGTERSQALKAIGVSETDAVYYNVARQDNDIKYAYLTDFMGNIQDRNQLMQALIAGRKKVNDKNIVSDGVLDQLYDDGLISYSERKQLKAIKDLDTNSRPVAKKSSGSGKKIKTPKVKKIKLTTSGVSERVKRVKQRRSKQYNLAKVKKLTAK